MTKCGLILGVWVGLTFKNQPMSFTVVKTKMKNPMNLLIDAEKAIWQKNPIFTAWFKKILLTN